MVAPLEVFTKSLATLNYATAAFGTCAGVLATAELARRCAQALTDRSPVGIPESVKEFGSSVDENTFEITSTVRDVMFPLRDEVRHTNSKLIGGAAITCLAALALFELTHRYIGQPFSFIDKVSVLQVRGDSLVGKVAGLVRG